jgi:hypothetical protein
MAVSRTTRDVVPFSRVCQPNKWLSVGMHSLWNALKSPLISGTNIMCRQPSDLWIGLIHILEYASFFHNPAEVLLHDDGAPLYTTNLACTRALPAVNASIGFGY